MRNFGNSLNPLNHIPGMIKNFGRNAPEAPPPVARPLSPAAIERLRINTPNENASGTASPATLLPHIDPPIQRFVETQDARDLRIGDVAVLLEDYKRLAAALKAGAVSR
ncbi:Vacuolar sorting protein 9 subgroup [Penicillium chermesinum]|uniref:Vacuolar sorting protein 9 subgroup n=1 Tax=Penicillium chermesinum TaxID=63820 RepID=A0A9W9TNU5_9EURO|nr:Vacuolar sorting protein 9 subgroup [Penicillium chermesinum]KAJ5232943.1 Vacuolar sorting protein 9 subgroup [Penicillium chermesinum]